MKKFLQFVMAIKTIAALAFTGGVMLVTVASMFFDKGSIPISYIWQMIFLALIYGGLQLFAFSENTLGRIRTPGRIAFLGVSMMVVLAVFALIFGWFPAQSLMKTVRIANTAMKKIVTYTPVKISQFVIFTLSLPCLIVATIKVYSEKAGQSSDID